MHDLTIAAAADAIARRALSPVELTAALIARAEALDPQLDAYLRPTFDRAMAAARAAEAAIMADAPRGPLHGIPYGLKDVFDVAGLPTTGQSRPYADNVAQADAAVTARLEAAGAILLGKLTTHEGAHGGPSFDLAWPPARNPWDRTRFTGGSSSGSGAAVAAGFMPLALGTDTGGSIRNPAALCGLVGLKPTYGLVSRRGVMPNSFSYDHVGPMTWTVADCAIALQALAGHDARDTASADRAVPDYRAALTGDIRGLRIGVLRQSWTVDPIAPAPVAAALEAGLDVLRGLGATLGEARIRPLGDYFDVKVIVAESEIFAVHEQHLRARPGDFGEDFLARILPAILVSGADYVAAQRLRRVMLAEFAALDERFDVLVAAAPSLAPTLDAWRPIHFWSRHSSLTTAFNVSGGPALAQCIGFAGGLPMAWQVVGRPFDDATVLRVADAYERATPWRGTRPELHASATRPSLDAGAAIDTTLPPVPDPEPVTLTQAEQDELRLLCRGAGLTRLNERAFAHLCNAAPYLREMIARLPRPTAFGEEPVNVFQFGH